VTPPRTVIGFKVHTGWTTAVAVTIDAGRLDLSARRRATLVPDDESVPRFVYHAAAELDAAAAAALVERAASAVAARADALLAELLASIAERGAAVHAAGVLTSGRRHDPVPDLAAIVRAHPLIHAAEGRLFQHAIVAACARQDVRVLTVREREVWAAAADATGEPIDALRDRIDGLRASAGAPWGADHKTATAAALAASGLPVAVSRRAGSARSRAGS